MQSEPIPPLRPSQISHVTPTRIKMRWLIENILDLFHSPELKLDPSLDSPIRAALTIVRTSGSPLDEVRIRVQSYIRSCWGVRVGVCCPEFHLAKAVLSLIEFIESDQGNTSFVVWQLIEARLLLHHGAESYFELDNIRRDIRHHLQVDLHKRVRVYWMGRLSGLIQNRLEALFDTQERWREKLEDALYVEV